MCADVLLLALGSPHGADQLAWVIGGYLSARSEEWLRINPINDPLRVSTLNRPSGILAILDATTTQLQDSPLWRFRWPDLPVHESRPFSSHALDLKYGLELAETLGNLPELVLIYAIDVHPLSTEQSAGKFLTCIAESLLRDLENVRHNPELACTGPVPTEMT